MSDLNYTYYQWGKVLLDNKEQEVDISPLLTFDRLIFGCAEEYEFPEAFETINLSADIKNKVNFIFGSVDSPQHNDYKEYGNVYFWSNHWLYRSIIELDINHSCQNKWPQLKRLYITLNHRPRIHRCMMLDELAKMNLLNDGFISWHRLTYPYSGHYNFQHWQPEIMHLDFPPHSVNGFPQHKTPEQLYQAPIQLIGESGTDVIFMTEKTWRSILCQIPFLVVGAPGFHAELVKMGFKLYDEIFDYSFDYEPDLQKRIEKIVKEIKKIKKNGVYTVYKLLKPKAEYNYNVALNIIRNKIGIPYIAFESKRYNELIEEAICKLDSLE